MVQLLCPAKVNLYLRVLRRRADGYHDLVTVMQMVSLGDDLTITPAGEGISLGCDRADLPQGPENLVYRAALAFQEAAGIKVKAHLKLHKKIPVAAGLGGGSSDAAGALKGLNLLYGSPLDGASLQALAASLGADVPFFLGRGPAVATGIGTELSPLSLPSYPYVLLNPGVPLSTRWVYENLDLAGLQGAPAPENWDPEHPEAWVHNDLGAVAVKRLPELQEWLSQMSRAGALTQGISGSGPTVFGLFASWESAHKGAQFLRQSVRGWLAAVQGLTGRETTVPGSIVYE